MTLSLFDVGLFLTLVLVIAGTMFFIAGRAEKKHLRARIARLTGQSRGASPKGAAAEIAHALRKRTGSDMPLFARLIAKVRILSNLRDRLERTGRNIPVEKYLAVVIGAFALVFLIVWLLSQKPLLSLSLAVVVGVGIPHLAVGRWASARLKQFVKLFPDGIDLIVRGLRSGLPVAEGIQVVAREVAEPVSGVFHSIADQIRLGVTLEKALKETSRKLHCTEFDFFSTSIILQRETGGNLSEILNNLSDVLRKRFMMRLKIKALSSEARASAIIIGALPFFVMLAVYVMSPGYLDPLFYDDRGQLCALGAAASLSTGIFIMIKMTKFEI